MLKTKLTDIIFSDEFYLFIQPIVDNKHKKIEEYVLSQRLFIEITESFFIRNAYSILRNTKLLADEGIRCMYRNYINSSFVGYLNSN